MKKFINALDNVLRESLTGLMQAHPELVRVHFEPTFVVRAAPKPGKVALISGGGSGHEPLHAGYVGRQVASLFGLRGLRQSFRFCSASGSRRLTIGGQVRITITIRFLWLRFLCLFPAVSFLPRRGNQLYGSVRPRPSIPLSLQ